VLMKKPRFYIWLMAKLTQWLLIKKEKSMLGDGMTMGSVQRSLK